MDDTSEAVVEVETKYCFYITYTLFHKQTNFTTMNGSTVYLNEPQVDSYKHLAVLEAMMYELAVEEYKYPADTRAVITGWHRLAADDITVPTGDENTVKEPPTRPTLRRIQ